MGQVAANGPPASRHEPESGRPPARVKFKHKVEYFAARSVLGTLGLLPHSLSRAVCSVLGALSYWLWPRLRRVGLFNLGLAFPDWTERRRRQVMFRLFQNLGRMLADFSHFRKLNRANIERLIHYEGFEHYEKAKSLGKGVLFLTAHFGNWELSSFAHGLYGHPLNFVVRELDNPLMDAMINNIRSATGGRPIEKKDFAFQAMRALKRGEAVGILMDQNMLPAEGIFVEFFGRAACTTFAPARLVQKTGVPMVLGVVIWNPQLRKYTLHFEPVEWIRHEDPEQEIAANTQNFTRLIEEQVRAHPDHWLWVHRRWKTRPPGEPPLYPF
jgi:Kdo2-lipid IVA lauroyltransferase/acyltransferase